VVVESEGRQIKQSYYLNLYQIYTKITNYFTYLPTSTTLRSNLTVGPPTNCPRARPAYRTPQAAETKGQASVTAQVAVQ